MGGVTADDIRIRYDDRIRELQAGLRQLTWRQLSIAGILAVAAVLSLVLGVAAVRHRVPVWWPALPLPIIAAAVPQYRSLSLAATRSWRLKRFYQAAAQRVQGLWAGEGHSGDEFLDPDHPYARDLNLFGEGSLFELLSIARTAIGRRGLADWLLAAPAPRETLLRQEAVRELVRRPDLREAVATIGEFESAESRPETFTGWLNASPVSFHPAFHRIAAFTSTLTALLLLSGLLGLLSWTRTATLLLPFVLFHSVGGLVYRNRVRRMTESLRAASVETRVLREGLQVLAGAQFRSGLLVQLTSRVHGAPRAVRKLEWLLNALHERNKEWFYPLSLLLMGATQLCMAIDRWRTRHGPALRDWIAAWAEFEALNALANYACENPGHVFPEFSPGAARFDAVSMANPLLPGQTCVRNDVRLDAETRFYIVSGSNMSGKSSLLRAIGLNAVLAFAGAPVPAESLRLSALTVCASIAVTDSLLKGKSRFLSEMDRVRQTVESTAGALPVLFLIDEIFSGTNSRDRRAAAEAVVRTLVDRGAIGALSTHDMSLTEIAAAPKWHGCNVHLGAKDPRDPMSFDYRLKPGITTETNALAIARMAGVPV
jgi:hypothetical protein